MSRQNIPGICQLEFTVVWVSPNFTKSEDVKNVRDSRQLMKIWKIVYGSSLFSVSEIDR